MFEKLFEAAGRAVSGLGALTGAASLIRATPNFASSGSLVLREKLTLTSGDERSLRAQTQLRLMNSPHARGRCVRWMLAFLGACLNPSVLTVHLREHLLASHHDVLIEGAVPGAPRNQAWRPARQLAVNSACNRHGE